MSSDLHRHMQSLIHISMSASLLPSNTDGSDDGDGTVMMVVAMVTVMTTIIMEVGEAVAGGEDGGHDSNGDDMVPAFKKTTQFGIGSSSYQLSQASENPQQTYTLHCVTKQAVAMVCQAGEERLF